MIAAGVEATCAFWLDARADKVAADEPADDQWAIAQARRTARERARLDLIAELRTDTLESFDRVLNVVRSVPGVASTETSILLSTHKI